MFVTCSHLARQPRIRHGFFTRKGGVSEGIYASLNTGYGSGDDLDAVSENRRRIAHTLGVETSALCSLYQVHSPDVITVTQPWEWKDAAQADALVTNQAGIALAVLTADCAPILLADSEAGVIGAAHAGWKGAYSGVIGNTVEAMAALGAKPERIHASVGPCIAQASYETGPEFFERLCDQSPQNQAYFSEPSASGHRHFDLKAYVGAKLVAAGVLHVNLLAQDTCFEENQFFSYRRACLHGETAYGRQMSAITLEPV